MCCEMHLFRAVLLFLGICLSDIYIISLLVSIAIADYKAVRPGFLSIISWRIQSLSFHLKKKKN